MVAGTSIFEGSSREMDGRPIEPQVGMEAELSVVVTQDMTASRYGNTGVRVLATPYLIGLAETVAVKAIEAALAPGQSTVGTRVDVRHEAATPVGMQVTARGRLISVDGRRLTFQVEVRDEQERVLIGTHERMVVELKRFLDRAQKKRSVSS